MYDRDVVEKQAAYGMIGNLQQVDRNPTVEENIDTKIEMLKAEIKRLEESKVTLAPLLKMRIRDVREAMQY